MKDSALKHKHNVSISGGTDLVRTKVSFSYDDVDGLYGERKYQRMMLRANNDATIVKDKLFATVDINIRRGKNITPNFSPFDMMRKMPAIYAATWDDGRIAEGKSGANPYGLLVGGGNAKAWSTQVGGRASLEYKPVKGLSIQAVVSPFINYSKTKTFRPAVWYTPCRRPRDDRRIPRLGFELEHQQADRAAQRQLQRHQPSHCQLYSLVRTQRQPQPQRDGRLRELPHEERVAERRPRQL